MPADTVETPPSPSATLADVDGLNAALRDLMVRAKRRHRNLEQTSDHGRIAVLFVLVRHGPMRASDLAREVSLDLSTVSRHLRVLEEDGRVAKSADPDDKRAFQVGATERGHDFVEQFWNDRAAEIQGALSSAGWTGGDVRAFTELLHRFVRDTEGCFK